MKSFSFHSILLQIIIGVIIQHAILSNAFTLPLPKGILGHRANHVQLQSVRLFYSSSDIFVLSYDGVVADTNEWRANLAIKVALETWPHLQEYITDDDNNEWLINKVSALLPVTLSDKNGMMGCDAVLLARLLLEEQLLDEGRSNGRSGKYGSKFHPSSSDKAIDENSGGGNGSRPLTVGEITANWNDGAYLKDTVRIKYNVDRKDPIPVIKGVIKHFLKGSLLGHIPKPQLYPSIADALFDCGSSVFILTGDESHIPTAAASLSQLNIPIESITCDQNDNGKKTFKTKPGITLLSSGEEGRGHEEVLQNVLLSVERGSLVHLIHSDVATLQQAKSFFGDNRPRPGMFGKSDVGDASLKLSLCTFNSGPQQQNDATMDPWLNLIDEFELVEILSARIVTK